MSAPLPPPTSTTWPSEPQSHDATMCGAHTVTSAPI